MHLFPSSVVYHHNKCILFFFKVFIEEVKSGVDALRGATPSLDAVTPNAVVVVSVPSPLSLLVFQEQATITSSGDGRLRPSSLL